MSADGLTPEDTAAMRATPGDWREYLRSEMDRGRQRAADAAKPPDKPARRSNQKPGAWPAGTRPPDPPEPIPPEEIQRAITEYRHWLNAGSPPGQYRCECPNCQLLEGGTR
ncbi:hypothetical protein ABZX65_27040 [Streptomyces sp. NPDC003300]|uniref:hypothetical protein n=1 Tax=unclassified Streptomyces TaxID=2593676 RepID=UPI0033A8F089